MAKENKQLSEKEIEDKLNDLKVELLKQTAKRRPIKREIARLLTVKNLNRHAQASKVVQKK